MIKYVVKVCVFFARIFLREGFEEFEKPFFQIAILFFTFEVNSHTVYKHD